MRYLISLLILFGLMISVTNGQNNEKRNTDSLIKHVSHDTSGVRLLLEASDEISFFDADSGRVVAEKALQLAKEIGFKKGEAYALGTIGETFHFLGEYPQALKLQFEALQINRDVKDSASEAETLGLIGIVYNELGQYKQALQDLMLSVDIFQRIKSKYNGSFELANIGDAYYALNIPDSGFYYQKKAYEAFFKYPRSKYLQSFILRHMGDAYARLNKVDSALKFYNEAIENSLISNDKLNRSMTQNKIAEIYKSTHQYDSAIVYARKALENAQGTHSKLQELQASNLLSKVYEETRNPDSAFYYLKIGVAMRDSLYGPEKIRQLQLLMLDEQQRQEIIQRQHEQYRNKIRYTALIAGLAIFSLLAFLLWRNNQHKKKSNLLLQKEKQKVEQAYEELKSTQAQLIQREKMASLGELTAGIAHEIQNPLNFVNNFSEVNAELIEEMHGEMDKGNAVEAKQIAIDIKQNLEKINLHGKRADAIVKGMLQHSRTSLGKKESVDINLLAEDYLKLAYHGFRAKDKNFNVITKTNFDHSIGKTNIVPQDIGRVILNLINNAFYAVDEKKKSGIENYDPTVSVSTKKLNGKVEIKVADNGNGIPQKVLDKIFQPFFTTKPTGQGTGLGLSLSYDIITKGHGGELRVETKEGEGSEFIIQLPVV